MTLQQLKEEARKEKRYKIREMVASGYSYRKIAKEFNLKSASTISFYLKEPKKDVLINKLKELKHEIWQHKNCDKDLENQKIGYNEAIDDVINILTK